MSATTIKFAATGKIQTYVAKTAGTYVIEAAGAQGGDGATPGIMGARVSGMFYLKQGDLLKIVAGRRGMSATPQLPVAGRGGDSLVWTGSSDLPQPVKLMLSARGGKGATAASPGAGKSADSSESSTVDSTTEADVINFGNDAPDQETTNTLVTQWTRGTKTPTNQASADSARGDRCGYNAGAFKAGTPEVQADNGYVSITMVAVPSASSTPEVTPVDEIPGSDAPSQTILPHVTPRPASWAGLLRKRPPPDGK